MKRILISILSLVLVLGVAMSIAMPVAAANPSGYLYHGLFIKTGPINENEGEWATWQTAVGSVEVIPEAGGLRVRYATNSASDWYLLETHLAWAEFTDPNQTPFEAIPHTKKSNNPIPGHFPLGGTLNPPVKEVSYLIPGDFEVGDKLLIVAHAIVGLKVGDSFVQVQTAWGDCKIYPCVKWAKYFIYER